MGVKKRKGTFPNRIAFTFFFLVKLLISATSLIDSPLYALIIACYILVSNYITKIISILQNLTMNMSKETEEAMRSRIISKISFPKM